MRFQKRIKLFPGVRLNLSKTGISASVGRPGASINIGKKGVRGTVGLPGTGLSHSQMLTSTRATPAQQETAESSSGGVIALIVQIAALALLVYGAVKFAAFFWFGVR